jgi:hypothetical protein
VSTTNTAPAPVQLEELLKQNLVLLPDDNLEQLPADLKENEIIFIGEYEHKNKPLILAASRLAVHWANYKPVVYAVESCYGIHPLMEAVSLGAEKQINPMLYTEIIRAFNSNQTTDRKILMTAIDIEHSISNNKKEAKLFLQDLANRSTSDTVSQAINKEIAQLIAQDTFDKMNLYLKKLEKLFLQHLDTFSPEDRDEILFSMELVKVSNHYQSIKEDWRNAQTIRYRYFKRTIKRAYNKAQKRNAILLCRVGTAHARFDYKLEAWYFAKKYSPTKGKVAVINLVPLYYDARETNDTVTEEYNDIDSIVKILMKDYEYSYLPLSELQKKTLTILLNGANIIAVVAPNMMVYYL